MRLRRRPRPNRKPLSVDLAAHPRSRRHRFSRVFGFASRFHQSSAFHFLEDAAILSSRAFLFDQTSRDLAALIDAHRSSAGNAHREQ